jgi:hypothetical protein
VSFILTLASKWGCEMGEEATGKGNEIATNENELKVELESKYF